MKRKSRKVRRRLREVTEGGEEHREFVECRGGEGRRGGMERREKEVNETKEESKRGDGG